MLEEGIDLKLGYIVKMYPRISETFILNEMLELERRGARISIFSLKKPNEGIFHPQVAYLKARAYYLEGFDVKKWGTWLGELWEYLAPRADRFWPLLEQGLAEKNNHKIEMVLHAAWIAARGIEMGISHFHAHFASQPSTMAYYAHLISGIPFSFTAHAKDIFVYDMKEHLLAEKLAAAKFVVTVTNYNYKYLTENAPHIDPSVIKVIHNGIDLDEFTPVETRGREESLILGVGRLVPKKGFGTLLDACRLLKDKGVDFKCLIVGDGSEWENLHNKKTELGLTDDDVEFTGAKTLDEVLDLMRRATLFCLPCTVDNDGNQDALPTVIIEALALGLPVISTTISGVPEMVDHEINGALVEPDNPIKLTEWIERILSSRELQARFSLAGRKKAQDKFDLKQNIETMIGHYLEKRDLSQVTG
ncbi:MAG: glycosyltransferase family 4 protein [candidate division Zixibacteria bacterium]